MLNIDKVNFLTPEENECLWHLNEAQKMFNKISAETPQHPSDTYNFGHYVDAARQAIIMRGARRLDPDNLMPKPRDATASPTVLSVLLEGK